MDEWLTTDECRDLLAREFNLSMHPQTLKGWRTSGVGPPWHKSLINNRVWYKPEEVREWYRSQLERKITAG